jgi:hypothetical protein
MWRQKVNKILLCLLICTLPLLGGWFHHETVEGVMRDYGFRLKKKEALRVPNSSQANVRYIFTHRMHKTVIVNEYANGLVEISTQYNAGKKESPQWGVDVMQVVTKSEFRQTIHRYFMKGEY